MKSIKITQKTLSIQHPQWFLKALELIHSRSNFLEIDLKNCEDIHPTGQALLEVLQSEAEIAKIKLKVLFSKRAPLYRSLENLKYPYHSKPFSLDRFESALSPLFLDHFLGLHQSSFSEDDCFDFRMLFNELTQNAKDHSGSERFFVYLSPVELGVFDTGVSIPAKIEQMIEFKDDRNAIEFALKKGVTTRKIRSGGLGLHYTLSWIKNRNGFLYIASRYGQIRRYLKNKKVDRKILGTRMPGTLIYLKLPRKEHQ